MSDFQLSDFQKRKLLRIFKTFFDINNDQVIEWEDFEIAIEKTRKMHNWLHGSVKHKTAQDALKMIWEGLKKFADQNMDDKITIEEWFKMWTECAKAANDCQDFPEWHRKYMDFMFDVNDVSGDGFIDKGEYTTVYTSYGISKEECEKSFDTFAEEGKIDEEQFRKLWTEYILSDDPADKGNFLFGFLDNDDSV